MLLWREGEVRGKWIHPLGGIMRGSSCLPLVRQHTDVREPQGPTELRGIAGVPVP